MTVTAGPIPIRAPRGTALSCKGWHQEAALRMLMNNLDPDVAERPEDLVVYGGTGKAARDWERSRRTVAAPPRVSVAKSRPRVTCAASASAMMEHTTMITAIT